jgi:hypothetical protein
MMIDRISWDQGFVDSGDKELDEMRRKMLRANQDIIAYFQNQCLCIRENVSILQDNVYINAAHEAVNVLDVLDPIYTDHIESEVSDGL